MVIGDSSLGCQQVYSSFSSLPPTKPNSTQPDSPYSPILWQVWQCLALPSLGWSQISTIREVFADHAWSVASLSCSTLPRPIQVCVFFPHYLLTCCLLSLHHHQVCPEGCSLVPLCSGQCLVSGSWPGWMRSETFGPSSACAGERCAQGYGRTISVPGGPWEPAGHPPPHWAMFLFSLGTEASLGIQRSHSPTLRSLTATWVLIVSLVRLYDVLFVLSLCAG